MSATGRAARRAAVAALALAALAAAEGTRLRPLLVVAADEKGAGMRSPQAVACDGAALLVVADTANHRLLRYAVADGRAVPQGEIRAGELTYPVRVRIAPDGTIVALDGKTRRLVRLTAAGEFRGYVTVAGETEETPVPRSFALDGAGALYVLDVFHGRILVAAPDGKPVRRIAFARDTGFLSDLAVGADGTVYAVDSVGRRLFAARAGAAALTPLGGVLPPEIAFPVAVAADTRGRLFVADQNGGAVLVLGADGSVRGRHADAGWGPGALRYPAGLCACAGDTLAVADRDNNRVQIFGVSE